MTFYEYVHTIFERNTIIWSIVFGLLMAGSTLQGSYGAEAGGIMFILLGLYLLVWNAIMFDIRWRIT